MILDYLDKYKDKYAPLILVIIISIGFGLKAYGYKKISKYIKTNGGFIIGFTIFMLLSKVLLDKYGIKFDKKTTNHHIGKIVTVET
tara:strand:+ start:3333 stop:3590 length:258 start_codon:yes stop_codon:yes gene_type:complete